MGVQIEIFIFSNLCPSITFWKLGCLRRKQPSSPRRVERQPPPHFSINRPREAIQRVPDPYALNFSCFGWKYVFPWRKSKSRCFRSTSETFPWAISWRFSIVLHRSSSVLRAFFILQPVSFRIQDFQFISCFVCFHLHLIHFRFSFLPFLTCFNRLFKPLSRLINDKMNFNRSFVL